MRTLTALFARWRAQARLDFMWMTRDFRFFVINVVSDIILNLAGVTAVFLLAERFGGIGPWSRDQILFMLGYAALVRGILEVGFGYNVLAISRRIGRGQLDHTLAQPQPLWMALATEGFMPFTGLWPLLAGIGITVWAILQAEIPMSAGWWLMLAGNLAASCAVVLAFSYLCGSLAFWAPVAAEEISSRAFGFLYQLKSFPLDGLSSFLLAGHAHRPAGRLRRVVSVPAASGHRAARLLAHAAGRARLGAGRRLRLQERTEALCTNRIAALRRLGTSRLG